MFCSHKYLEQMEPSLAVMLFEWLSMLILIFDTLEIQHGRFWLMCDGIITW